jgi:hypothetical protein
MTAFRDIAPSSLVETDRHFRGAYCLHHQGDESLYSVGGAVYTPGNIYPESLQHEHEWSKRTLNLLKPSGNYMYHLL